MLCLVSVVREKNHSRCHSTDCRDVTEACILPTADSWYRKPSPRGTGVPLLSAAESRRPVGLRITHTWKQSKKKRNNPFFHAHGHATDHTHTWKLALIQACSICFHPICVRSVFVTSSIRESSLYFFHVCVLRPVSTCVKAFRVCEKNGSLFIFFDCFHVWVILYRPPRRLLVRETESLNSGANFHALWTQCTAKCILFNTVIVESFDIKAKN